MPLDNEGTGRSGNESLQVDPTDERTRFFVLRVVLVTFICLTTLVGLLALAIASPMEAVISFTGGAVYLAILLLIPRLGTRRAGILCTTWYFVLATATIAAGRGVNDITMVLFPAGMFLGALLLDRALLVPLVGYSVVIVAVIGTLKVRGFLGATPANTSSPVEVVVASLLLLVSGTLTYLIVRSLQRANEERRLADEAAVRSTQELEARHQALELVNGLAHRLHRKLDIESIAKETVGALVRLSSPPSVAFYLLEDDGRHVRMIAEHGFSEEEKLLGARLAIGASLSGVAIRERKIIHSIDIATDRRMDAAVSKALKSRGFVTAIAIPLIFDDRALGNVNLVFREPRDFTPVDLDTFGAIGQAVSLAITNSRHLAGLEHQAYHDSLTTLPNRAGLHRDFAARFSRASVDGRRLGLALLDLNRFREINEALGHHVGDELLASIGARLVERFENSNATAYRLGADEFAVLAQMSGVLDSPEALSREILASLSATFPLSGMALEVAASVGVATFPEHASNSHELLRCADVALHQAKRSGARVAVYRAQFDEHTPERLALMSDLGKAVREGQLVLHYQPQVALEAGSLVGFEALVRWQHPRFGLLPPARFLPLAEASEIIHPLTYTVVESALQQLKAWDDTGLRLIMAINLSARNLLDQNCAQKLEEIIRRVDVDPTRVEFELTETAIMSDPEKAVGMLERITATGAKLAIDDFGTGYSSLAYLRRFPVNALKIDRSFVSEMLSGRPRTRAIVDSTVHFARSMEMSVVAEGVENQATVDALREIGCDMAQGYFFARPAPAHEFGRRLMSGAAWGEEQPSA